MLHEMILDFIRKANHKRDSTLSGYETVVHCLNYCHSVALSNMT